MQTEVTDLRHFGSLQSCKIPITGKRAFQGIHALCAKTPCNLSNYPVNSFLTPEELKLLNQSGNSKIIIFMTKTADGMVFHAKDGTFLSGMYGKSLYKPNSNSPLRVFSVARKPGPCGAGNNTFKMVMHDDHCDYNELSRHAICKHIMDQILAVRNPCPKGNPNPLFKSKNFGVLSSRILNGPKVDTLKCAFLNMVSTMGQNGGSVYDKSIKLNDEFRDMLMLGDHQGKIMCDRCNDSIVGYTKDNNKKIFLFFVNTNDFHATRPLLTSSCYNSFEDTAAGNNMLQVIKMDYAPDNTTHRIMVLDSPEESEEEEEDSCSEEEDEEEEEEDENDDPLAVYLHSTLQKNLNRIEKYYRKRHLERHSCEQFSLYCNLLDKMH